LKKLAAKISVCGILQNVRLNLVEKKYGKMEPSGWSEHVLGTEAKFFAFLFRIDETFFSEIRTDT